MKTTMTISLSQEDLADLEFAKQFHLEYLNGAEIVPKRSIRRHHRERLKKKRRMYWNGHAKKSNKLLGMSINTPKTCSCLFCGNPRRHFKQPTRQEIIFQEQSLEV